MSHQSDRSCVKGSNNDIEQYIDIEQQSENYNVFDMLEQEDNVKRTVFPTDNGPVFSTDKSAVL